MFYTVFYHQVTSTVEYVVVLFTGPCDEAARNTECEVLHLLPLNILNSSQKLSHETEDQVCIHFKCVLLKLLLFIC